MRMIHRGRPGQRSEAAELPALSATRLAIPVASRCHDSVQTVTAVWLASSALADHLVST
jgi:hypothetical protein